MIVLSVIKLIIFVISVFAFLFFIWRWCSNRYALPCPSFLGWMVELDNPFSKINRAATIIKHADLAAGMTVLDVGCGPGRLTILTAHVVGPSGNVVAMDIQKAMLDKVAQKAQAAGLENITFLCAGIGDGKLEHNKFDRALLITVLGEVPHKKRALQEIYTALKPGGTLCITETVFDPHYQRYSPVLQLAQEVGFQKKSLFSDWFSYTFILQKIH